MQPTVLFIISSDPRTGPRAAEAVRIAAGVSPWQKLDVAVYLRDAAVLVLGEGADDLVDADQFSRYLPILTERDRPVYAQSGNPWLPCPGTGPVRFAELSDTDLARLAAESHYVLRF